MLPVERRDRQADPVEGDRAAFDDVTLQIAGELDPDAAGEPVVDRLRDPPDRVDVALDDVAAKTVGGPQRRLEVDRSRRRSSSPSEVSSRVWFMTSASKAPARDPVAVRQTPETAIESPSASSPASSEAIADARAGRVALDPLDRSDRRDRPVNIVTTLASGRGRARPRRSDRHSTDSARSASPIVPAPTPPSNGRASVPPSRIGAKKRRSSSSSPASRNDPGQRRSALEQDARDPAAAELVERRPRPEPAPSPGQAMTSTPAAVSASTRGPRRVGADDHDHRSLGDGGDDPALERQPGARVEDRPGCGWRRRGRPRERSAGRRRRPRSRSPIATASRSARQRWTSSRDAAPEIHLESPAAVAVRPSRVSADLRTTSGRPVRACLRNAWLSRLAAVASAPSDQTTSTPPSRRISGPRPLAFGGRIVGADHDPADARGEDRLGAGRLAALVRAGLERHVHRRAGQVGAAARGRPRSRRPRRGDRRARRESPRRGPRPPAPAIDCADERVRADRTAPAGGQLERTPHPWARTAVVRSASVATFWSMRSWPSRSDRSDAVD